MVKRTLDPTEERTPADPPLEVQWKGRKEFAGEM